MSSGDLSDPARRDRVLFQRYAQSRDPQLKVELAERFLPLARQLAQRYRRTEEPLDDLVQVASLGLIKAIDRFDTSRGVAFSTYAVPTIVGELKRHFRDRTWSVRVPRDLQDRTLAVDKAVSRLSGELGRPPTVMELGREVGTSEEQVLEALQAAGAYRATSFDAPRGGEDGEPGDTLADTLGQEETGFGEAEDRATLGRLFARLPVRDREVLHLRFDLDLTQAEIAARVGLSQMQVSRIIRQSIAVLRSMAGEQHSAPLSPAPSPRSSQRTSSPGTPRSPPDRPRGRSPSA